MKHSTAFHGIWLIVALSAFGVGHFFTGGNGESAEGDSNSLKSHSLLIGTQEAGAESSVRGATGPNLSPIGEAFDVQTRVLEDRDIEALAKEALSDPNPLKRQLAFARLLEGLTAENAELIREQMRGGRANGDQWRLFQYAWGAVDGEGALAMAKDIERKEWRNGAMSQALAGWASASPQQAIDWLEGVEDEKMKRSLQNDLVGGLADSNIPMATDYVLKLATAGDKRATEFMGIVAGEQLRKDGPLAAAMWAERLPDGSAKGLALDRVANAYVARDPKQAAAWAEQFATADYGARVIDEVGEEWAERDPASAVSWLESLEDGRGKREGFASALGEWVRRDPTAASQYLVDMPASKLKDTAVNGFVSRLAWEDPQSAIVWADSIQSEKSRTDALTRAGQAFFIRDREAAIEWLPNSGLSAEAQKKVLETRRDRRRRG